MLDLKVKIDRDARPGTVPFTEVFKGFELVEAVRDTFGKKTDKVLENLNVELEEGKGYMRINDKAGSIVVNTKYLKEGEELHLYLDVIHELVHIRQHIEGKELWDKKFAYVDRPTEVEAYKAAVKEARRIGLGEEEIAEYLKVEWVSETDFGRMLKTLGVRA
jgi:hypothetical protein